ncbi:unnamed protein product [Miscanthus lutarioriparius]|uniref:Protein CPR-5 n=1 Tax=Miscanthus lutarioriparius TaxID=422564 RepID=A0A811PFU4_9POAL|nr:unnamed protein product [Miscanthus lutarioriparius]
MDVSHQFWMQMCTSAVKESLTNIYGDKFQSFMSNFEKAFGSTLRTIHLINETPVYEQDMAQCSYKDGNSVPDEIKLGGADSLPEIKLGGADSQNLIQKLISSVFERSLNEQARSNELKELVIGLTMRKLQLSRSQLALSSDSHMLEKIKVLMGFQKASFKEKKFKTEMEDTKHAELFRKLIDMLLTAVVLMSVCFGYGTYIYSYQRITAATSACAAISREYTSWWMPSSVSAFNSGLLLFKCHVIAATRIFFGILMLLLIGWLIFQRSAMTGPNMPVTFNVMILGVLCGYFGSRCVDTLGGDGNVWLIYWEALCSIHLLGNIWPSLLHRMLYGPISVTHRTKAVHLPYWARRYTFYVLVSLILPCLAGLLPFASVRLERSSSSTFEVQIQWK